MGSLGRKLLIDRIYPALSKHEIGTSEDRELVVRWQSEIEGAIAPTALRRKAG
jgi:hypothetical protein